MPGKRVPVAAFAAGLFGGGDDKDLAANSSVAVAAATASLVAVDVVALIMSRVVVSHDFRLD